MQRLLTLTVASIVSGALVFSQATVTAQASPPTNPHGVSPVADSNGKVPSTSQGNATRTPSTPNQALPGNANPANAGAEGSTNGQAITPNGSRSVPAGNSAARTPDDGNPVNPNLGGADTLAKPGLNVTMPWLWAVLAIVAALMLIGLLMRRDRSRGDAGRRNNTVVPISNRDGAGRDHDARKAG
jgi:hypothetical protein